MVKVALMDGGNGVEGRVYFPEDPALEEKLGARGDVRWNPDLDAWIYPITEARGVRSVLEGEGYRVGFEDEEKTPGRPSVYGVWAQQLFDAVPANRRGEIFKALAVALHPLTGAGSTTELFEELVGVWAGIFIEPDT